MGDTKWSEILDGWRDLIEFHRKKFKEDQEILNRSAKEHQRKMKEIDAECNDYMIEKQTAYNREIKKRLALLRKVELYKESGVKITPFAENLLNELRDASE